ncbi:serine/threonine-protein phosphatase 2A 56 kDa regulatory subunit delta 1 isoform [Tritrichomonas foetus]|uniref:Serine/threonine-protein phosphatase 2A 56 kDa regulatory subunit delta 1 isoform n=1 Tax=Tritrichomonas foetus TaxID=1144522 RepID=A0A1J4JQJ8_9EUKA|nr:serine/threonine-protein phosphatase 2A 56 kDa regulatory subunit delta 1 isoform [Tritrichomonas foetus]|eukprot:OHT01315.1 serine/threonine-protein phosphatase 2A 56 kDa regulatory subunit delta 1 isoform [Tritrichomonas foetus]
MEKDECMLAFSNAQKSKSNAYLLNFHYPRLVVPNARFSDFGKPNLSKMKIQYPQKPVRHNLLPHITGYSSLTNISEASLLPHLEIQPPPNLRPAPSVACISRTNEENPITLKAHIFPFKADVDIDQIEKLIESCSSNTYYFYTCEIQPKNSVDEKILTSLDSLLFFTSNDENKMKLTENHNLLFFEMIKKHIFHPFPDISRTYVIGEAVSPYHINNWEQLQKVYLLMTNLVSKIAKFIDKNTFKDLIKLLSTPNKEEQESLLSFIEELCNTSELHYDLVFHAMTQIIELFRDGLCLHFCINPILTFLTRALEKAPLPIDRSYFATFRSSFYPIIVSPNVVDFYFSLVPFAKFFQSKDSTTAVWCARFLFRHWPHTNSQKQVIFLHQLQSLLSILSSSFLPALSHALIGRLRCTASSVNFKIAMAAIRICKDEDFMKLFAYVAEKNIGSLIPVLEDAKQHWNRDVRKAAVEACNLMRDLNVSRLYKQEDVKNKSRKSRAYRGWRVILELAAKNDKNIDVSEMKAIISVFDI